MSVPLLDLSRQHGPLESELQAAFSRVLHSGRYILSEEVSALEAAAASYTQSRFALGMSSGTDALLVALMALGIGPGDEVLCPAFTFFGTAGCVARLGAVPVWVDARPDTYNLDLADAEAKITPRTKAIIAVHLFGQSCDMECLLALAGQHRLQVIEDAAQSLGARYHGQPVGSFGAFGIYSFYPTKNLGALGDAGLLVTQDEALAERARSLRNHGMNPRYYHAHVGGNFRLDALQAALLSVKWPHLDKYHAGRQRHAAFYLEALKGIDGLQLPRVIDDVFHVWNQFTVRVSGGRRDALRAFLQERGIATEIYYPLSLDRQVCFQGNSRGGDRIRVAHELAASVLSLPIFPEMTSGEAREVVTEVQMFFGRS